MREVNNRLQSIFSSSVHQCLFHHNDLPLPSIPYTIHASISKRIRSWLVDLSLSLPFLCSFSSFFWLNIYSPSFPLALFSSLIFFFPPSLLLLTDIHSLPLSSPQFISYPPPSSLFLPFLFPPLLPPPQSPLGKYIYWCDNLFHISRDILLQVFARSYLPLSFVPPSFFSSLLPSLTPTLLPSLPPFLLPSFPLPLPYILEISTAMAERRRVLHRRFVLLKFIEHFTFACLALLVQ